MSKIYSLIIIALLGSLTTFGQTCIEPVAQPEDLNLNASPTIINGDFSPTFPASDAYLIVRSATPALSASPVDGVTYTVGQALGGGIVRGYVTAAAFSDAGLTPNTLYYYFIFSVNSESCTDGPNYFNTNPLIAAANTQPLAACVTPTAAPATGSFIFNNTNSSISGSFTPVAGANRYLVVFGSSNAVGPAPVNGQTYTAGTAWGANQVLSFGSSNTFIATGLNPGTTYYVQVYSANAECTGEPFYRTTPVVAGTSTSVNATGIPVGYYDGATSLSCQPLKTALKTITGNGYVNIGYDGVYQAYQYTDIHRNDANTANIIYDIYSDNPTGPEPYTYTFGTNACGNYNSEGDCYNREHSTPKSWFNDALPMYADIQHLYPTDGYVNGKRSNFPYGEVTSVTYTSQNGSKLGTGNNFGYTATVFEPINAYKGDLARTSLYMATRYEDEIISQNWAGNSEASPLFLSTTDQPNAASRRLQIYDTWYLKTIFKWIGQDPVSQKEIDRNNAIYYQSGQHNRNPFVDHPEYAALIWQCTGLLPVTITDFTATKFNESVILKWYATLETGFRRYDIERSTDGVSFNKIGDVPGQNLANYTFTDYNLPMASVVYYRLKMVDVDEQFQYSKVAVIRLNNNFSNAITYPNPTTGDLHVKLLQNLTSKSTLIVTDMSGRKVLQQIVATGQLNIPVDVRNLPAGRYFIRIFNEVQVINQSFVIIR